MWPLIRFRISFSRGCKGIPYYLGVLSHMSDPFQGPWPRRLSGSSWRSCSLPSDHLPWRQQLEKKEMMDRFLTWTCLKLAAGFSYRLGSSLHPKKFGIKTNVVLTHKSNDLMVMIFFLLLLHLKCNNSDVLKVKNFTTGFRKKWTGKIVSNPNAALVQYFWDLFLSVDRCWGLSEKIRVKHVDDFTLCLWWYNKNLHSKGEQVKNCCWEAETQKFQQANSPLLTTIPAKNSLTFTWWTNWTLTHLCCW